MGKGKDGPIAATRGGFGAVFENNVGAGSHRGCASACAKNARATLCRAGLTVVTFGGGGCVRTWWYAPSKAGWTCGTGDRVGVTPALNGGGVGRCDVDVKLSEDWEYGTGVR